MRNKGTWIFWGVIGVIALGVAGFFGVRHLIRGRKLAPFKEQMAAYTAQPKGEAKEMPLRGKIIPIDIDKKEVDDIYWEMPEDMRADKPDDVGTIVWLKWGKEQIGTYTGGSAAEVQTVVVTVIDKKEGVQTHTTSLRGGNPPQSKKSSQSGVGPKPTTEIINFLKALPRG